MVVISDGGRSNSTEVFGGKMKALRLSQSEQMAYLWQVQAFIGARLLRTAHGP
ncbi:hypothetical protein [Rhizobium sp. NXC24]|uniref:hypothetical protein n=1 Tax=Rhizobium sp. NXC24 TaxID=2048897 RepID=UPI00131A5028|nr:hypothetical protein [Rhizobium sp. NXC24]